jgi:muconolactone delta-isomerase
MAHARPVREFLTTFTVTVPAGTPGETATAREADRARDLATQARHWAAARD